MSRAKIPGPVRAGLFLLVLGAIIVGIGTYANKGSLSLYGFIVALSGFLLYFLSFILTRNKSKAKV